MCDSDGMLMAMESDILDFADQCLDDEAQYILGQLCQAAYESDELKLCSGNPHLWAAALTYLFARMNFLFENEDGPMYIDKEVFFEIFDRHSPAAIKRKAKLIEKTLNFYPGHPDFCLPEVVKPTSERGETHRGQANA